MNRLGWFPRTFAISFLLTASSAFSQSTVVASDDIGTAAALAVASPASDNAASAIKDASKTQMNVTPAFRTEAVQPENDEVGVLFLISRVTSVTVALTDENGNEMCPPFIKQYDRGMHRATVNTRHLPPGTYNLAVTTEGLTRVKPFNVR